MPPGGFEQDAQDLIFSDENFERHVAPKKYELTKITSVSSILVKVFD